MTVDYHDYEQHPVRIDLGTMEREVRICLSREEAAELAQKLLQVLVERH